MALGGQLVSFMFTQELAEEIEKAAQAQKIEVVPFISLLFHKHAELVATVETQAKKHGLEPSAFIELLVNRYEDELIIIEPDDAKEPNHQFNLMGPPGPPRLRGKP